MPLTVNHVQSMQWRSRSNHPAGEALQFTHFTGPASNNLAGNSTVFWQEAYKSVKRSQCLTHKYVDDTTLTESYRADHLKAEMQLHFEDLHDCPHL